MPDVFHAPEHAPGRAGVAYGEGGGALIRTALCMALPSSREGYGLVVVEAAASATPSVVVAGEDNAATELVDEGENGFVAASASAEEGPRRCATILHLRRFVTRTASIPCNLRHAPLHHLVDTAAGRC